MASYECITKDPSQVSALGRNHPLVSGTRLVFCWTWEGGEERLCPEQQGEEGQGWHLALISLLSPATLPV